MAKFMQIIDVNENGAEIVLHPETNADYVETGTIFKIPKIVEISDWNNKSKEIVDARKGQSSLLAKINLIDTALRAENILKVLKTVDGSGSGLDADLVDGRTVDDDALDNNSLWTSLKTKAEINKMVAKTEVVSVATPNKILQLDNKGMLPTSITKNAATATRLENPVTINYTGDVTGEVSFVGNGETRSVDLQVKDNSHKHNKLEADTTTYSDVSDTEVNLFEFKSKNQVRSYIDKDGNFSGGADNIGGYKVNNFDQNSIWTGEKVQEAIEAELQTYAQKIDDVVTLGPVTFMSGSIPITGVGTVVINPPQEIREKILTESYIIVSNDKTMTYVKDPLSDNTSIRINLNKLGPANATLSWYITAI